MAMDRLIACNPFKTRVFMHRFRSGSPSVHVLNTPARSSGTLLQFCDHMMDLGDLKTNETAAAEVATFLADTCFPKEDLSGRDPCACYSVSCVPLPAVA